MIVSIVLSSKIIRLLISKQWYISGYDWCLSM